MFNLGDIIFEYTVPRIGTRIDIVLIVKGIIFLLEFKVGAKEYNRRSKDQVMDYALDLKYFHEQSKMVKIVSILVATKATGIKCQINFMEDKISEVICCNKSNIGKTLKTIIENEIDIDVYKWVNSRYVPTPTIIEAAQTLYRNHSVENIFRDDAGAINLTLTTKAKNNIIEQCKTKGKKAICFVTGVPGAGKTLAGLNIANGKHKFEKNEHAVFLSGNGPLVDVLRAALVRIKQNVPE